MKYRLLIASGVLLAALANAAAQTNPAPPAKPKTGHEAYLARLHACSAEWKSDKAAGKQPAGMKWPKFWSDCDKRMKAQGM